MLLLIKMQTWAVFWPWISCSLTNGPFCPSPLVNMSLEWTLSEYQYWLLKQHNSCTDSHTGFTNVLTVFLMILLICWLYFWDYCWDNFVQGIGLHCPSIGPLWRVSFFAQYHDLVLFLLARWMSINSKQIFMVPTLALRKMSISALLYFLTVY